MNYNALWFAQVPEDITYVGDATTSHIAVLVNDAIVDVSLADTATQVIGDYTSSYVLESVVGAERIAAASSNLTFLLPDAGAGLWSSRIDTSLDTLSATDSGAFATVEYTEEYTTLKTTTYGDIWFGREPSEEYWLSGVKYEYVYSIDVNSCCGRSDSIEDYQIPIYQLPDPTDPTSNIFSRTIALDVDTNKTAVAVFKDTSGLYRVSIGYYETILGDEYVKDSGGIYSQELIDVAFVKDQSGTALASTDYGTIALLDKTNGRVYFDSYFANIDVVATESDALDDLTSSTNYVEVGSSPVSLAFNADKDTLFILNEGDNTITAFNVKDSSGAVLPVAAMTHTKQTINLSDYFVGKSLTFTPNKIIFQETSSGTGYLMIGMEGIEGAAVFEAPTLTPPAPRSTRPVRTLPEGAGVLPFTGLFVLPKNKSRLKKQKKSFSEKPMQHTAHHEHFVTDNCGNVKVHLTLDVSEYQKIRKILDQAEPASPTAPRKSLMGLCSGMNIHITEEDIAEARKEMWGKLEQGTRS